MSFTSEIKDTLARLPIDNKEKNLAELIAVLLLDGQKDKYGFIVKIENAATARRILKLLKIYITNEISVSFYKKAQLKKNNVYCLRIINPAIINSIEKLLHNYSHSLAKHYYADFLRGVFLASGSVNGPGKDYHLELHVRGELSLQTMKIIFDHLELTFKYLKRKNRYIIYLKNSEIIFAFLSIIEAHKAMLELESSKILKEMKNNVNRSVNCETANINKALEAGLRQIAIFQQILASSFAKSIAPNLREIIELRLDNSELNLKELGELCHPPLSKGQIYQKIRRLEKMNLMDCEKKA
ncbi:MAG: DNA-binding protein WhiA [Clostridia bacterium]